MYLRLKLIPSLMLGLLLLIAPGSSLAEDSVGELLSSLSLPQKVGQMFMVTFYGSELNEASRQMLVQWQPGAVALLPSNLGDPVAITRLTNSLQETVIDAGGLPLFIAADQEGGLIQRLDQGFTRWPAAALLTAAQDRDLSYRVGLAYAEEMRAVGLNMNLAPVLDLDTNRLNPIIGRRSPGADPQLVAYSTAAFIQGMQVGQVLAAAKHFPGHGDTAEDSHITLPLIPHDLDRLEAVEFVPFRAAIEAGVGAIMIGHLAVPAIEPDTILAASLSANVINETLRQALAFDGLILPDAMDMDAIDLVYPPEQAALLAIQAGHDMVLLGAHLGPDAFHRAMQGVVDAVLSGTISEDRIDASVRRILRAKEVYGLLSGFQALNPEEAIARLNLEAHNALIQEMFAKGITTVYDRGLLPLSADADTLVIYPATRPGLWRACAAYGAQPLGVSDSPSAEEIAWARSAALRASRVVVFTTNAEVNPQQRDLVRNLPMERTTVVALWSPYDLLSIERPAAYMVTYSPLAQSYEPLCAILFGSASARGSMPLHLD